MKIRTDFVTNSSSSSFTLMINFELKNGEEVKFVGHGGGAESGTIDFFDNEVLVDVSPKELGTAETIDEMIELLTNGVRDDDLEECPRIFVPDNDNDSYYFIKEIEDKISSMDDIEKITIRGDEENYQDYLRSYTYDRETKKYTGMEYGEVFEKDGSSGGDLVFDLSGCDIQHADEEEFDYIGSSSGSLYDYLYDGDVFEKDWDDDYGEIEPNRNRIEAYFEKGHGNEDKLFVVEFENSTIEEIIKKYNYSCDKFDDPFNIDYFEEIIPGYAGVKTIEEFTKTLISLLVSFGHADSGFEEELNKRFDEILAGFSSIKGTSCETIDEDAEDFGLSDGYDFKLINGVFKSKYRTCEGGW